MEQKSDDGSGERPVEITADYAREKKAKEQG